MAVVKQYWKVLLLLGLITALICSFFWLGSRYPALNLKALMAGGTAISGIGFDVLFELEAKQHVLTRILYTTLNWLYSNMIGMSFGLLIAPVLLCLFTLLAHLQPKNGVSASLLGTLIGIPLGVCANCATPIAYSLRAANGRLETMLALIISSPTLNIIAITMMLAILPSYIVVIKLGLTLLFIIAVIPWLSSRFTQYNTNSATRLSSAVKTQSFSELTILPPNSAWGASINWLVFNLSISFWRIIKIAVPFMVLAGVLGACLITLFPADLLTTYRVEGYLAKTLLLAGVSIISVLLPVPMTFDVILATNLHIIGVEARYVSSVLFGLGVFSLYPYLLIRQQITPKVANSLLLLLIGFSFVSGIITHYVASVFRVWENEKLELVIADSDFDLSHIEHPGSTGRIYTPLHESPNNGSLDTTLSVIDTGPITLKSRPFIDKPSLMKPSLQFDHYLGNNLGIDTAYRMSIAQLLDTAYFKSIATADINQDGWQDLLLTDTKGPRVFINTQKTGFLEMPLPGLDNKAIDVTTAAFADLNNDGLHDLVYAHKGHGLYLIYNQNKQFNSKPIKLANLDKAKMTTHVSFSDINKDGWLDIIASNWSIGSYSASRHLSSSTNAVLFNRQGKFTAQPLSCNAGETLTSLSSDINHDQWPDLIVGNDFRPVDCFYTNDKTGLVNINPQQLGFERTPKNTMSYASGDINNDGLLDVFASDIADPIDDEIESLPSKILCQDFIGTKHYSHCEQWQKLRYAAMVSPDYVGCVAMRDQTYFEDCSANIYFKRIMRQKTGCDTLPGNWVELNHSCNTMMSVIQESKPSKILDENSNSKPGNALYVQSKDGLFNNREDQWGVKHTGWSWNAKFADLNHDEWQDLYIVTGFANLPYNDANQLFINDKGKTFIRKTTQSGLKNHQITTNYVYIDIDNDGDLDIISNPPFGPVEAYINQIATGSSLKISLRDHIGNHYGIGAKVRIYYGNEQQQLRELLLSGGFNSYDAPELHFGLGQHNTIDKIVVEWPTGKPTVIEQDLSANHHYFIHRQRH